MVLPPSMTRYNHNFIFFRERDNLYQICIKQKHFYYRIYAKCEKKKSRAQILKVIFHDSNPRNNLESWIFNPIFRFGRSGQDFLKWSSVWKCCFPKVFTANSELKYLLIPVLHIYSLHRAQLWSKTNHSLLSAALKAGGLRSNIDIQINCSLYYLELSTKYHESYTIFRS